MIDYEVFPDCKTRNQIIEEICNNYRCIRRSVIGSSLCRRCIDALQIGNGKRSVLYCGGFHGMEYLTVLALLKFAEECAAAIEEKSALGELLCNCCLTIVPCVNPDGTEIAINGSQAALVYKNFVESVCADTRYWQANARGVDINHNFNAGWCELKQREISLGITAPSCTRFGGFCPESEPETRTVTQLCRKKCFDIAIALHSQGREIYWSFGENTPKISIDIAEKFAEVSGYKIAEPEEIATGGGFKDWFIDKLKRPGFTIEMGLGKNPLPLSDFAPEYPLVRNILVEGLKVI